MKTTVGVFFGGRSVEHEISVISALQAIAAMDAERYRVVPVYISKSGRWFTGPKLLEAANYRDMAALEKSSTEVWMRPAFGERTLRAKGFCGEKSVAELDVAIPVLHGTNGEDGTFQGLLELVGIPYAGCGVLSAALGMDKIAAKMVLRQSGLPTIDYVWFTDRQWSNERAKIVAEIESTLGYPVIVKPANLGSSVGIARARNGEELVGAVSEASCYSARLLVERMVEPLREINCSVLGSVDDCRTSVCEEPIHSDEILSYADKYMSGGNSSKGGSKGGAKTSGGMSSTKRQIPADLSEAKAQEIRHLAAETFRVLGCDGVARVDFIVDGDKVFINEINAIPGSLSFYLWEATGLKFGELMDALVAGALRRESAKANKTVSYSANIFSMGGFGGAKGAKG